MSRPERTRLAVTEHAAHRWLERSGVIDGEAVRAMLATALDRAFQAALALGSSEFQIVQGGLVYVVREGVLITVLEDRGHAARSRMVTRDRESG